MGSATRIVPSARDPRQAHVFNVGGNKYRLICRIRFASQKVFVLKVMTHGEFRTNLE
jgi:mRNA-degrading endonuclease HigB of HigAB toxin-antitoxin module